MRRGLSIEVDPGAVAYNLKLLRRNAGGAGAIAVVKADAYGHGAVEMSRRLTEAGAGILAVAFVSEARELRRARITSPILVLFDSTDIPAIFSLSLTPVVHDLRTARELSKAALKRKKILDIHIKVDTGMGRMGFPPDPAEILTAAGLPGLRVNGLMSHFADADLDDKRFSLRQIDTFNCIREKLSAEGLSPLCHMANSAAALTLPEASYDAVRPGIALYGVSPFSDNDHKLRPAMSVRAPILAIRRVRKGSTISYGRTYTAQRDMLAAVLACGYADGYPRALSNRSEVIIRGRRVPIVGRVCMDLSVADVTDVAKVGEKDTALLLGSEGRVSITAWDLAHHAGTIPYEILTGFGRSAVRRSCA